MNLILRFGESPMSTDIVIPVSELGGLRERLARHTIVLATGCFDILHVGHLYFLESAAAQGDVLVVGVNSDRSIKMMKGHDRPIVGQDERAELVSALRYVDYVFIHDSIVADDYIHSLKPDVFVVGEQSVQTYPSESAAAEQIGARVHIVMRKPSLSTTSIMADILSKALHQERDHSIPSLFDLDNAGAC